MRAAGTYYDLGDIVEDSWNQLCFGLNTESMEVIVIVIFMTVFGEQHICIDALCTINNCKEKLLSTCTTRYFPARRILNVSK